MNKRNLFNRTLILFFAMILAVPVFWVARGKIEPQRSLMEYRVLTVFPSLSFTDFRIALTRAFQGKLDEAGQLFFNQFWDLKFQNLFQRAVNEQFPLRSQGIQLSKNLTRQSIRAAYLFTGDEAIPADNRNMVYEDRENALLFPEPEVFRKEERADIDMKIDYYDTSIKLHQNQNFYAFYIEVIEDSAHNPLNQYFRNADAGRSFPYFMENKPEDLRVEALLLNSYEDQLKYFYRTDHHWNVRGMLLGYEKIYNMLAENYPDITPMQTHDTIYTFPDIEFHGRWARAVFYQIKPGDVFEVPLLNLPPYKIYDIEGNELDYNHKDEYLAGDYSRAPFADHYIEYNGKDVNYLEYVFENGTDRNLLIIGDSFTNAIEPLLASHYHHTYAVDIRHYPDYYFSLSEFLSTHDVDDILVLGGPSVVMHQWRWTINP